MSKGCQECYLEKDSKAFCGLSSKVCHDQLVMSIMVNRWEGMGMDSRNLPSLIRQLGDGLFVILK